MRTAQQILDDAAAGKLEPTEIKIRETAKLRIRDVMTGVEEERIIVDAQPRTVRKTLHGFEVVDLKPLAPEER